MLSANDMVLLRLFPGAMVSLAEAAHNATFGECSTLVYWPISRQAVPAAAGAPDAEQPDKVALISGAETQGHVRPRLAELFLKGSKNFSMNLSEISQKIEFTIISARASEREPLFLRAVCINTR